NEADLDDIPEIVRSGMTFHLAETLHDVMEVALVGGSAGRPAGRKKRPAAKKPAAKTRKPARKPAKKS
ncbi:MAG: hypothetical protein OEO79_10140, partial [Gemmatimonadota bacterium]|nr:hypothetical protein [Gemmatimonadota bacterium]